MTDNNVHHFTTLYGMDKNDKVKEWNICVIDKGDHSEIMYSFGQMTGRKTECRLVVSKGKNIGKKNETSHFQQAILQAGSKWSKKKDIDGYKENTTDLLQTNSVPLPMLAQDYKHHKNKIVFPCFVQPKLDGYRMVFDPMSKKCFSRTGKEYKVLYETDLYKQLLDASFELPLDGELYVHDPEFQFESYGVLRKQTASTEQDRMQLARIEYHVYDYIDETAPFKERTATLASVLAELGGTGLKHVATLPCSSENDLRVIHDGFLSKGYEGTMVRNAEGKYKPKYRSNDLQKYKNFDDGEFPITGFTHENDVRGLATGGVAKPLIVWICKTPSGHSFNVPSKGTREERQLLFAEADTYIGRTLWVQYFGLTADGIPRFPKTMRDGKQSIRDVVL